MPSRLSAAAALLLLPATVLARPQATPPAASSSSFDALARRAGEARESGRLEDAAGLYREAVRLRPRWAEGWWSLGAIGYERDRFAECRDAFRRLVTLQPKHGQAWALRGLCEFGLGEYVPARDHVEKALGLGVAGDERLGRVLLYHHALLLVKASEFELAIAPLTRILQTQAETPELIDACGLVLLRRATLPSAIPPADRALVAAAGGAYCAHLAAAGAGAGGSQRADVARRRYEELLARYPTEPHLHYGYGLALAQQGSAEALDQFRKEIELNPDEVLARVELAFSLLTRGQAEEARAPAEKAVELGPGLFVSHLVLGRALAATGDLPRGIVELETAARLAPGIAETHLALSRAYAQAGRQRDAERAGAAFQALEAARRGSSASGSGTPPKAP